MKIRKHWKSYEFISAFEMIGSKKHALPSREGRVFILFILTRVNLGHLNDLHANIPQLFHHGGRGQFIGDDGTHFLQVQAGIGADDAHLGVVGQDEVAVGVAEHGLVDAKLRGDAA